MAQRDRKDIQAALNSKGFVETQGDHYFYHLVAAGQKARVMTKISRGSSYKVYGDPLLGKMCRQLFLRKRELLLLIDCPMDEEAYLRLLRERGILDQST